METPWVGMRMGARHKDRQISAIYSCNNELSNLILFRETGVLDSELNLASIPYMGSPEGLRHFFSPTSYIGRVPAKFHSFTHRIFSRELKKDENVF